MASWYRIKAEGSGPAIVYLYGTVGQDWWGEGNSALDFAKELDDLGGRDIELRVNSEGGDVFEGYAIYSALNRYQGRITAYVDGLAASAASFLIMAADEVVMGEPAFLMIHNSWTFAIGNADELRDVSDRLDAIDGQIVGIYERKSGKSADDIAGAMAAETWFTSEQALEWGLIDRIDEGLKAAACVSRERAKLYAAIPESVVVSDAPATVAEDAPAPEAAEAEEQALEAEIEPQERPVARVRAYAAGVYRFK